MSFFDKKPNNIELNITKIKFIKAELILLVVQY